MYKLIFGGPGILLFPKVYCASVAGSPFDGAFK